MCWSFSVLWGEETRDGVFFSWIKDLFIHFVFYFSHHVVSCLSLQGKKTINHSKIPSRSDLSFSPIIPCIFHDIVSCSVITSSLSLLILAVWTKFDYTYNECILPFSYNYKICPDLTLSFDKICHLACKNLHWKETNVGETLERNLNRGKKKDKDFDESTGSVMHFRTSFHTWLAVHAGELCRNQFLLQNIPHSATVNAFSFYGELDSFHSS